MVDEHEQKVTHTYLVHYPEHGPRESDPHYIDFNYYKKTHKATAKCAFFGTASQTQCTDQLELHHAHIEFALTNGVSFDVLEKFYPGISNPNEVGAWVESEANFQWLCSFHHRGHGGAHVASASDFEAQKFVKGLLS